MLASKWFVSSGHLLPVCIWYQQSDHTKCKATLWMPNCKCAKVMCLQSIYRECFQPCREAQKSQACTHRGCGRSQCWFYMSWNRIWSSSSKDSTNDAAKNVLNESFEMSYRIDNPLCINPISTSGTD